MTDTETRLPQPGDRVRIVNRKSYGYGREGVVTHTRPDETYPGIVVEFAPGDDCLYGPSALEIVSEAAR